MKKYTLKYEKNEECQHYVRYIILDYIGFTSLDEMRKNNTEENIFRKKYILLTVV